MEYDYNKRGGGLFAVIISGMGCASCEAMHFSLNEVLSEFKEYTAVSLDERTDLVEIQRLKIERVPCLIIFHDGEEKARVYGYQPTEILSIWLENLTDKILHRA